MSNFNKFIQKNEKGAKLKESIRQEKKKQRQETKEYFAQQKLKRKNERAERETDAKNNSAFPGSRQKKRQDGSEPSKQPVPAAGGGKKTTQTPGAAFVRHSQEDKNPFTAKDRRAGASPGEPSKGRSLAPDKGTRKIQPANASSTGDLHSKPRPTITDRQTTPPAPVPAGKARPDKSVSPAAGQAANKKVASEKAPESMPLNKYVAHAGVCSRRDAADLVKSGKVSVNGQAITEPGFKVSRTDDIRIQGKKINASKNLVYILLNKPKDHITTTDDPQGRKTVMDIVRNATDERVYPVGRLDRNTTGVLILTNDGELAQKLSHPSYEVRKIYEVTLDRPLVKKDFDELLNGLTLEDGFIAPDSLAYADAKDKSVIGIEIHSGKNRIVRRIFEKLGYDVRNLDRVMYANLTKKNVERGKWRFLQEKEVRLLKFMNASYGKKK